MEPLIRRVKIKNYKSIAKCDVSLGRLTILVGRNGSGKSNFLDALRFIVDSLQTSLDHAIKSRGGIDDVRRRGQGQPLDFGVEVEMQLAATTATYGFEIASRSKGGFEVKSEKIDVRNADGEKIAGFKVSGGEVTAASPFDPEIMPQAVSDRLYLVSASGLPEFREAYNALLSMGFYNLNPEQMKEVQSPDAGRLLQRDGSNIASVIAKLAEDASETKERIKEYLEQIIPDISDFDRKALGHRETVEFRQKVSGSPHPWKFYAANMSDGTLRTLGILVATMQWVDRENQIRLVGIEEPETALHPAAAGALMDSLREAGAKTQVIITTHSPELLDRFDADNDTLLCVASSLGTTEVATVDKASLETMKQHLYTAGELLRMDQLQPDPEVVGNQAEIVFD